MQAEQLRYEMGEEQYAEMRESKLNGEWMDA